MMSSSSSAACDGNLACERLAAFGPFINISAPITNKITRPAFPPPPAVSAVTSGKLEVVLPATAGVDKMIVVKDKSVNFSFTAKFPFLKYHDGYN
jgi:hypothetical protein